MYDDDDDNEGARTSALFANNGHSGYAGNLYVFRSESIVFQYKLLLLVSTFLHRRTSPGDDLARHVDALIFSVQRYNNIVSCTTPYIKRERGRVVSHARSLSTIIIINKSERE